MIKCPNCDRAAPFYVDDVNFDYDETTASVMYSYKCVCGKRFSTITIYISGLGEQLIENEAEENDE